ncbi:MAG: M56 family metallopeptidase [Janthinobacterium lividum]
MASLFTSFIIPKLTIPVNPGQQQIAVVRQVFYVNTLQTVPLDVADFQNTTVVTKPVDWMLLLKVFYCLAVTALTFHLIITLIIFFKKLKGKQISKVGHVNILRGDKKLNNGSFFNYIFLNDQELSADKMQQIIAHEMLHVKLYHSVDRLLVKIAQVILWFNPFIYFYAKSIEVNHEFEVDRAIANSTDKKIYADLLVHLSVTNQGMLYHSFSKIPLKKRITMLFNKPSAKMKKVIYVLILPVVLLSCLAFARLKRDQPEIKISAIKSIEKLGINPLVVIDGKIYPKDILYKIGPKCIKVSAIWSPNPYTKRQGIIIKDGYVEITTNEGRITYLTKFEKENLIKERSIPEGQFYTRLRLHDLEKGGYLDKIVIQQKAAGMSANLQVNGKAGFLIDNKLYSEAQIKNLHQSIIASLSASSGVGPAGLERFKSITANDYDIIFYWDSSIKADTTKYRQKLKRSPEQIKGEADFKAYRQTDDFKQKEKLARDIEGKVVTVKIKAIVDKANVKDLDVLNTGGNHKMQGFTVSYNGNDYFMRTKYGQEKQLNSLLKVGDEITMKIFGSAFGPNSPIIIGPAFVYKNNIKIFQLAEAGKIPDYPFLYESNKVRFADGQVTHIQKYPNGKWKSAILEIVNGYKFNLNFKQTAPDFTNIEESDHVRFRFIHEVKTGAKTYQINDWVSVSNNLKDYGIKNPDFFYKFYETIKPVNQEIEPNFKVTKLYYQTPENMLSSLKKDQPNSYVSVGKTINMHTLKNEQERVYKFLSAQFPNIEKKDIVFNVDTTQQKGNCTVVTVVKLNS